MKSRILFITGTDTGVGKTTLTALLLAHGLSKSLSVLAMKPFCSGGRDDVELLDALQGGRLPAHLLNPFYFEEPVAPLASLRMHQRRITLSQACAKIREAAKQCDLLLVEGSGGLLVPLGQKFNLLDIIKSLQGEVIVASRNRLGTINHTLLTAHALQGAGIARFTIALIDNRLRDFSCRSNAQLLADLLHPNPLAPLPFLSGNLSYPKSIRQHAKRLSYALDAMLRQRPLKHSQRT